jgi:hypothetical protein
MTLGVLAERVKRRAKDQFADLLCTGTLPSGKNLSHDVQPNTEDTLANGVQPS